MQRDLLRRAGVGHSRDRPFRPRFDEAARQLENGEIAIDALQDAIFQPTAEAVLETWREQRRQSFLRRQDDAAWRFEAAGTLDLVTMQPADLLQQYIDRAEIRDQEICIDI